MEDPIIGEIQLFGFNFVVYGYLLCDGRELKAQDYPQLFSAIKNTYGGDGITTFALPNMKGMEPLKGMSYQIACFGDTPN